MKRDFTPHPPLYENETPPMIINEISHLFKAAMRNSTGQESNKGIGGRLMLLMLSREDGLTQLDIAKKARMSAPTISIALRNMETDGFVRREQDEKDMRQTRVFLTEKGRDLVNKITGELKHLDEVVMRGFTPEEAEIMKTLLIKARANLIFELKEFL